MRVQEKDSDRTAEVHLHAFGENFELNEYGQYVDPIDKSISSYVAVEEGMRIKVDAKFSGLVK